MLTIAALLEHLGLLHNIENGQYLLGNNAKKWIIYLYGDALLVNLHTARCDKIFLSWVMRNAWRCCYLLKNAIQKGQFHQLMHQL
jgi:hypothetical protein